MRNRSDIEKVIVALGQRPNNALIVAPDGFTQAYDTFIVSLAARHRVPTVFGVGNFARSGGLISYGPDFVDTAAGGRPTSTVFSGAKSPPTFR